MIALDAYGTFVAASLVLLLGRALVGRVGFLQAYSIPEPVVGGLIVALSLYAANSALSLQVRFDSSLTTPLMLAFFASIGLNADLASLRQGGKVLLRLLGVVFVFLALQNALGITLATLLGLDPRFGLIAGSITLSGGHGTGAAWGAVFSEQYGIASATEVAMACATFGLILGGLLGGPVARFLVSRGARPAISAAAPANAGGSPGPFENPASVRLITAPAMIETLALFSVCLMGGSLIAQWLRGTAFELPAFVCVLFVGVVLRNALAALGWYAVFERCVSVLGNVALALFLAMSLMSLRLWELASLALPMLVLLFCQTLLMASFAIGVTFRVMGRNYDAAVIAAGHCGFGMGATPTAIANMQAVTDRFGPSPLAFLVVPMVGAFFIDIANAVVIKLTLLALGN